MGAGAVWGLYTPGFTLFRAGSPRALEWEEQLHAVVLRSWSTACPCLLLTHPLAGLTGTSLLAQFSFPKMEPPHGAIPSSRAGCELDMGNHKTGSCNGWSMPRLPVSPWLFFCSC